MVYSSMDDDAEFERGNSAVDTRDAIEFELESRNGNIVRFQKKGPFALHQKVFFLKNAVLFFLFDL